MDFDVIIGGVSAPARDDCEEISRHTNDGIEAFRNNAGIGKYSKYRFIERFHCSQVAEYAHGIPAQMIAHILYYFSDRIDLVFDPMAGGGVAADTCLAFNRKFWSFDMDNRTETRPEIEPCFWDITDLKWPINQT